MANTISFYSLIADVFKGVHDFETDSIKVVLTNTAPSRSNTVLANITEISAGDGYSAGGEDVSVDSVVQALGELDISLNADVTWTSTGTIGPFRYAVFYNDTPTSPLDPLIGYLDIGSSKTLASGESHKLNLNGISFVSGNINSGS